ncbi:MAG: hypothetical protein HYS17_04965 [Micavibrio aeruginosavorus]|uniref:Uncharacterized protein n=1 Tax=Micavibrio aeruginosavorus TaxID=349221 RepID=A0A7T5UIL7_9BACT|nr:MAG: hypothetical protein HYS17_04965 [Micavibrio aeruginosavorus]
MGARLISFLFNEPAKTCIEQCPQNAPDGYFDRETYEQITQLNEAAPLLKLLPDGAYAMVIEADPYNDPFAKITLIEEQSHRAITSARVDLRPIITSAIDDGENYTNLTDMDEDDGAAAYEEVAHQILLKRSACLEGLFKPYIENNPSFNLKLLDALDYLLYPVIVGQVASYNLEEQAQRQGTHDISLNKPKLH